MHGQISMYCEILVWKGCSVWCIDISIRMSAYMMLWMHVLFTHPKMCMALKIITLQIRVYYFVKSSERIAGLSALFYFYFFKCSGDRFVEPSPHNLRMWGKSHIHTHTSLAVVTSQPVDFMAFVAVLSHFWVEQGLSVAELCALMSNEIVLQPTKTGQSLVPAIPILTCQNGSKPKLHLSKPTPPTPHPPTQVWNYCSKKTCSSNWVEWMAHRRLA